MATIYDKFTAIANSISEKTGKTELLTLDDMAYEISTISGGLELNFNIKRYSSEEELLADTPSENTIGIISDIEITGYQFSAIEPEDMVDGMVWIKTDNSSNISFDIVDGVTVYPISAKQYIGGVWVDKTAKSYQGGEWVDLWNGTLFKNGVQYTAVTGGWKVLGNNCNITQKAIEFECKNDYSVASAYTKNIMDLKPFSKIKANIYITEKNKYPFSIGITKKLNADCAYYAIARTDTNETGNIELECDITSIDSGYPFVTSNEVDGAVKEIILER